jgi:predicted nucleic acid-binding protein
MILDSNIVIYAFGGRNRVSEKNVAKVKLYR